MKLRFFSLFVWLLAGVLYWWSRPAPSTQIEAFGMTLPPIPDGWTFGVHDGKVELLFLCVFPVLGAVYYWSTRRAVGFGPFLACVVHAGITYLCVMFATFPIRHEWMLGFLQWQKDAGIGVAEADTLSAGIAFALFVIVVAMLFTALRLRLVRADYDRLHY